MTPAGISCYGSSGQRSRAPSTVSTLQRTEILEQVQSIIGTQLEDPSIRITDATVADDVPDWDSVMHVRIIVAVETCFGIRFDAEEYMEFANVGEMVDCVQRRLAEKRLGRADRSDPARGA